MNSDKPLKIRELAVPSTAPGTSVWILVVGIIFVGITLRAPLTSVGPLIGTIKEDLQISNTLAGTITTLPLLAFAVFSPFAPKLSRRFGVERMILYSMALLTIGILLRSLPGGAIWLGTGLLGLAISFCNVLLPGLIKRDFPDKMGMMTGAYSVSMNLCGAIASGLSVPLAIGFGLGWQVSLGLWAVLSSLSLLLWLPQVRKRDSQQTIQRDAKAKPVRLWRSPLAWQVTFFMGIQSLFFYIIITWLPEILVSRGASTEQAGWQLSIMQLSVLPFTFVIPILAGRSSDQRPLVIITATLLLAGALGLAFGGLQASYIWTISLGVGAGSAFSLSMMFFGLRTRTLQEAAELSGMAQAVGYLLAAIGPMFFGFLHDVTGDWKVPLLVLAGAAILFLLTGLGAGRNRYVTAS